jgi:hypothetical protein
MHALIFALLFLGAAAVSSGAAAAQLPVSQGDRLTGRLDASTQEQVSRIVQSAHARGLPTEPLVNKALEGVLKQAPGPRIVSAVAALASRLETSFAELAPGPSEPELVAGANALAVGVPPATLRRVRAVQGERSVAAPLGVLAELVARGVPVERASGMVIALLERGATPRQLMAMSVSVYQDIAAGVPADAALEVRMRGVLSTLPPQPATAAGRATVSEPTPRP